LRSQQLLYTSREDKAIGFPYFLGEREVVLDGGVVSSTMSIPGYIVGSPVVHGV
jgi:hypothetical protein